MARTRKKKYKSTRTHRTLKKSKSQNFKIIGDRTMTKAAFLKYNLSRYSKLSPFELKNTLIYLARLKHPNDDFHTFLNAGRGNPNFFNHFVRVCFDKLQQACLALSANIQPIPHIAKITDLKAYPLPGEMNFKNGILRKLKNVSTRERTFIERYVTFLDRTAKNAQQKPNKILHDLVLSMLGCFYPSPPRIQPHLNLIVKRFMFNLIFGNRKTKEKEDNYEYFATEGAAAGILYVFNTLHVNGLLQKGDTIAIISPIFSPYLEMPALKRYQLKMLLLKGNPEEEWSLSKKEIEKLKDKKIKALFMVNPLNPGGASLPLRNIQQIGEIVNKHRQDLIILSDNVYAPFVEEYNSLAYSCPENTIEVYSLSKYFGTTGWRLGIVMLRKKNRLNALLHKLPSNIKKSLAKRYSISSIDPADMSFMKRLVDDSRQVAEAHVAGLSTPQQVMIGMMMFYDLDDKKKQYRRQIHDLLRYRMELLYSQLDTHLSETSRSTNYYSMLYIPQITENLFGIDARKKIEDTDYLHFLFHLAKKYKTVLLPGNGFGASPWYLRISLANLASSDYKEISYNIHHCIHDFVTGNKI